jgi:hypothetical protein
VGLLGRHVRRPLRLVARVQCVDARARSGCASAGPGRDPAAIRALRNRLGATIGFGLLWFVLLPIVAVALFVTIVGIPLGLFLLLALALVYTIGYVVGALALGRLVVKEPTSRYVAFLAGWVILRILALVPFLGGFAWLVATVLGLGTLWVTARAAPREVGAVAPALSPPPPSRADASSGPACARRES